MKQRISWKRTLGMIAGLGLLTGCQSVAYVGPNGERFNRFALGTQTTLSSLELQTATNGVRSIRLRGYQSDSTQAMGTITEAAVRAAVQAH